MAEDQRAQPVTYTATVVVPDAPDLPVIHVNALSIRFTADEFFFALGVVLPPEVTDATQISGTPQLLAQPVFRFAVSRQVMQRFVEVMANQFNQQTNMLQQLVREAERE